MNDTDYNKELSKCVKCGTCKTYCPTYYEERNEVASARGKIALIKALEQNVLKPTPALVKMIYQCTMCGACESSCSPDVNVSGILTYAREKYGQKFMKARVMGDIAKMVMPHTRTAYTLARGLQSLSPSIVLKKSSLFYAPPLASQPFVAEKPFLVKSRKSKLRVAFFTGCSVNYLFPQLGEALLNILTWSGYDVIVVKEQVCCGTPLKNLGLKDEARQYALKNCKTFNSLKVDAVLTLCPTCILTLTKSYMSLVGTHVDNVIDVNRFIIDQEIVKKDFSLQNVKNIVYHNPCHLTYGVTLKDEPRKILSSLGKVNLLESDNSSKCCGFGGIFRYNFPELSIKIGQRRFEKLTETSADTIVTSCPGCIMQFQDLAKRNDCDIEVKHVVELLWDGMKRENKS
jgi:glycolate oxidase iron-sulfur subunit